LQHLMLQNANTHRHLLQLSLDTFDGSFYPNHW